MDNSILFVGSNEFCTTLLNPIRDQTAFRVEVAADVSQSRSWLEVRPPDILIVQASVDGSLEFCRWLKQQVHLAWIYCILLEDRPQIIAERSQASWHWEFSMTAAALEESADAYVWLEGGEGTNENQITPSHRLLLAQIHVGLRKVKKYRDLINSNQRLSGLALVDPLTALNNRRALEWDLPLQIRANRTNETPMSLIMLDVDHFKRVNDTHGHLVGDRILQLLCARLRHSLRLPDTAFRYGGEEFVILLPNTDCQEALFVARRLNSLIGEQSFAIDNTLTLKVTISLGTACLRRSDDAEGLSLLDRADQHLLQAKAAGRNCVVSCEDQSCDTSEVEAMCS